MKIYANTMAISKNDGRFPYCQTSNEKTRTKKCPIIFKGENTDTINWSKINCLNSMCKEGDIDGIEKICDLNNEIDRNWLIKAVSKKWKDETGVEFRCSSADKEAVFVFRKAADAIGPYLKVYQHPEINMSIPDTITLIDNNYDGVKNLKNGFMRPDITGFGKIDSTHIFIDYRAFLDEFKGEFKTGIDSGIDVFHHELEHSRFAKENPNQYLMLENWGIDALFQNKKHNQNNEAKTLMDFKDLYNQHWEELRDGGLDSYTKYSLCTNLNRCPENLNKYDHYNMEKIPFRLNEFIKTIIDVKKYPKFQNCYNVSDILLQQCTDSFIANLSKLEEKFNSIINLISLENFRNYAFCNPLELHAVSREKEYQGKPLSIEMRNLQDDFGFPKIKHMSYLPENHAMIQKLKKIRIK